MHVHPLDYALVSLKGLKKSDVRNSENDSDRLKEKKKYATSEWTFADNHKNFLGRVKTRHVPRTMCGIRLLITAYTGWFNIYI